uniref:Uncharacterized protein n=1 Tax=Arundo donax TaxID=35708 RepID=A0A0A9GTA4_ARUDO
MHVHYITTKKSEVFCSLANLSSGVINISR